jgi:hypothetical protein
MKNIRYIMPVLFLLLIFSCSSVPHNQRDKKLDKIISLINSGDTEKLLKVSSVPFLFDGEILLKTADVKLVWSGLKKNSYKIKNYTYVRKAYTSKEKDYSLFSDSREVKIYFNKYLSDKSSIIAVKTADGEMLLLLDGKKAGYPVIRGIRGPVK